MKKIMIIAILLAIVCLSIVIIKNQEGTSFNHSSYEIENLNPPLLKTLDNNKVGKTISISGSAYPDAKILFFINNEYKYDAIVSKNGDFNEKIDFISEGEYFIKVKQTYKNISSDFSNELKIEVDLTPPKDDIEITTEIPEATKENFLEISGKSASANYVILNHNKFEVDNSNTFNIKHYLSEGLNVLNFKLEDDVGNATYSKFTKSVKVDNTSPVISTSFLCDSSFSKKNNNLGLTEEYVCIRIGNWQGYLDSYNSISIVGYVKGQIKSITVDGKKINWDENDEIYQRINLYIHGGLNKYKVIVEDNSNNRSSAYIETDAERDNQDININLEEY